MAARLTAYVVVAIVSVTLIAGLIVGAQRDYDGPVDLIVHNARIYTADEDRTMAEAVAIRGNQILKVGSNREINRLRRPQTIVLDARGAAVLPGFNDAHVHLIEGGLGLQTLDLEGAATAAAIQERIRVWAAANPAHEWVRARGWDDAGFEGSPTRQLLDAAVADRPVQITSVDRRTSWVNTKALQLAGITRRTANPPDGVIVRDRRGEPTGVLRGPAADLVARVLPEPTREMRAEALRTAAETAARHGITSVQIAGGTVEELELYDAARRANRLPVRVYGAFTLEAPRLGDADVDRLTSLARQYPDDPHFKAGAVTLRLDGPLDSHGAATLDPYAGGAAGAEPRLDPDDLNRNVRILDAYGWQVRTEAAGDRAVRMALNAYAHAVRSNRARRDGRRHRIEGAHLVAEADVERFDTLDIIASMQPRDYAAGFWTKYLEPERAERIAPYRSIAAAGGRLAFGSDWPEGPFDPIEVLQAAIAPEGDEGDAGPQTQRIRLETAVDAYTSGAAYASFDEQRKGSITPGMLADLVVLTRDIFDENAALAGTEVAVTIFDGRIVYRRGERTSD